ncbi:ankyrin repeat protein [Roseimicrobium gellanilyticum]|uniref:Ankyrin repeat protein n=2 Tax=Roseimicrobium gellanilyticum TaxID=748857 RepID=A0A366HJ44_9BACT|nr:ankyrin repeat protein [Roseimicrobium gellanilyticum]
MMSRLRILPASLALMVFASPVLIFAQEPVSEKETTREPDELHELAGAGSVAATTGNIPLMKALLQAGLPVDSPLTLDPEGHASWTALHLCCIHNQPAMMKFLLKHGAHRDTRDAFGKRPIDSAMEKGNEVLCKLLAIPDEKDTMLDGIPRGVIEELFQGEFWNDPKLTTFVCVNGKDPGSTLMFLLGELGEKRVNFSLMEVVENQQPQYRHKQSKEPGRLVEIEITPQGEFGKGESVTSYHWSIRITTGRALSGGGIKGVISRRYGYWIISDQVGWDE